MPFSLKKMCISAQENERFKAKTSPEFFSQAIILLPQRSIVWFLKAYLLQLKGEALQTFYI